MPTLREIASYIDAQSNGANQDLVVDASSSIVTHDSRRVMPGGIFVAVTGAQADGNQFAGEAAKRGAIAVVSEQPRPANLAPANSVVWM
ncbi:MAG: Mur ligase domain-containing protein, partial [Blastocatellia bacterium]